MLVAQKLKLARKTLSLSQSEVQNNTGLSQRDISFLENGKRKFIPIEYIQFLNIKGVRLDSLFNEAVSIEEFYEDLAENLLLTKNVAVKKAAYKIPEQNTFVNESPMEYQKRIPLVTINALGGFGNVEFAIKENDIDSYYVIPKFKDRKVDFLIEVSGNSMIPKYNSGDVVACAVIRNSKFIQWNRVHVIATAEQGILIKRVKKADSEDYILAISENKEYDPFLIPKDEIVAMALVVGTIRLD